MRATRHPTAGVPARPHGRIPTPGEAGTRHDPAALTWRAVTLDGEHARDVTLSVGNQGQGIAFASSVWNPPARRPWLRS